MLQNELLDVKKLAELAENEPLQIAGLHREHCLSPPSTPRDQLGSAL